ncbi:MAG TPA: DUF5615 family PIN-like protein [Candidatus Limnocylindrales bacterium]|nr:DUF5615 family PIN-like protein [Candidatus Limnocylindrales bacterium]
MKILVDENIPRMTVEALRNLGHDVNDIRGTVHQGMPDSGVWQIAVSEQRLLVTTDKGFTSYRHAPHYGVLVVRLRQPNRIKINHSVLLGIQRIQENEWPGLIVVIRDQTLSTTRVQME